MKSTRLAAARSSALLFCAAMISAPACLALPAAAGERTVGVMNFTYDAPNRDRLVQSLVLYPAETGGFPEWVGANLVFAGVPLQRDAKPERKKHPLIVVSHGSGGNAANLTWLTKRLAEAGFVVVTPNHQGSTSGDSRPDTTIPAMWQRPADISSLLDAIHASPALASLVDESNISAVGFSLGGATVLNMAGAEFRADRLAKFCDEQPQSPVGCMWFAHGNALIPGHVDLHTIDAGRFNAAHPDPRIKRFIAIDPAFPSAFAFETAKRIIAPVHILNLGTPDSMPVGLSADRIAAAIPGAHYDTVPGATHFAFLAECKLLGWFFIWMEGDDPVCNDSGSRRRADIHHEVAAKILAFLNSATP